jgi:hypothetical protein
VIALAGAALSHGQSSELKCPNEDFHETDGTDAGETLNGGARADLIKANGGDDTIHAGAGSDCVLGGAGNDSIYGEAGYDVLFGEAGDDRVVGGPGEGVLDGGAGDDVVLGGTSGIDYLLGRAGDDVLKGGRDQNVVSPGQGRDEISSGGGPDRITANDGQVDQIRCGPGRDRVIVDRIDRLDSCERVTHRISAYPSATPPAGGMNETFVVRFASNRRSQEGLGLDYYFRLKLAGPAPCGTHAWRTHGPLKPNDVITFRLRPFGGRDSWCRGTYEGLVTYRVDDDPCGAGCTKHKSPVGRFTFDVE